jgi:hypothetical protein
MRFAGGGEMKTLTYTTDLLHASLDGNVINYRLCSDGLESYWHIQGADCLYSAIDMGLFDAYEAMQAGDGELPLERCKLLEPLRKTETPDKYYRFVYDNNTLGAKWPSLSEALKHVNFGYMVTGLASNASWAIHPENINFRIVEDSTDYVKVYCNNELMFAYEDAEAVKSMVAVIASFLGGVVKIEVADGIERISLSKK